MHWKVISRLGSFKATSKGFGQQLTMIIFKFGILFLLQILHFWAWRLQGQISRFGLHPPFSIASPPPFNLNHTLTARSRRQFVFAYTVFRSTQPLKFPSTVQPMGFDSLVHANFCTYRFAEKSPIWLLDFGLHAISCYRSAYGV